MLFVGYSVATVTLLLREIGYFVLESRLVLLFTNLVYMYTRCLLFVWSVLYIMCYIIEPNVTSIIACIQCLMDCRWCWITLSTT